MIAWEKLLAASSLVVGTAWDLISSPKLGGAGVVVNDGVQVLLDISPVVANLVDSRVTVEMADVFVVALQDLPDNAFVSEQIVVTGN